MTLPSNEHFTQEVLEKAMPVLNQGKHITLNMENKTLDIFTNMENKANGIVKFFRVAKKALLGIDNPTKELIESIALPLNLYDLENKEETVVAVVTMPEQVTDESNEVSTEDLEAAAEHYDRLVLDKAQQVEPEAKAPIFTGSDPVTAPANTQPTNAKTNTKIVTGAENLKNQIKHFSESENPVGFTKFMQRIAAVVNERKHTIEDLLYFMNKGDLPIADDGSIIAYKRLYRVNGNTFVDTHTRRVKQMVGSRVFMDHSMVDPVRKHECSNGLHIGRRDYMGNFSGDVIIICKINPEDVIAVPRDYSGSKMRCAGYNIVAKINEHAFKLLCSNKPMTDNEETAILLSNILRGNHTKITQLVEIRGANGTDIFYTDLTNKKQDAVNKKAKNTSTEKATKAIENVETTRSKADPKEIAPEVVKENLTKLNNAKVELTKEQKLAKKEWPNVVNGTITKVALAKKCKTSSRSLERWAEKFKF